MDLQDACGAASRQAEPLLETGAPTRGPEGLPRVGACGGGVCGFTRFSVTIIFNLRQSSQVFVYTEIIPNTDLRIFY